MADLDEIFLKECLSELRDGETITVQVNKRTYQRMRAWLALNGATADDLRRFVTEGA